MSELRRFFQGDAALELEARGYGYVIGYNYHGGHANTPWPAASGSSARWISPQRLTDQSRLVLISDMNDWGVGRCFAPHGKNGPIMTGEDASNEGPGSRSSDVIGAAGGNLGLLDGSVSWKTVKQMQVYRGSQSFENVCTAMWSMGCRTTPGIPALSWCPSPLLLGTLSFPGTSCKRGAPHLVIGHTLLTRAEAGCHPGVSRVSLP